MALNVREEPGQRWIAEHGAARLSVDGDVEGPQAKHTAYGVEDRR